MIDLQTIWSSIFPNLINYDEFQINEIKAILFSELGKYTFAEKEQSKELQLYDDDMKGYTMFFVAKKVEGLKEKSLKYYKQIIDQLFNLIPKTPKQLTTDDIRYYLAIRQSKDMASMATIDNERRVLNSFFGWLADEEYISKNIVKSIKKIRKPKKKKKAFSETDIAKIKDGCNKFKTEEQRKRAIAFVEFLLSTGCRVNEISLVKKDDIDLEKRTAVVFGKGSKERTVYITPVAKLRLLEYWETRTGESEYAFCSVQKPYDKMNVSGLEILARNIGKLAGITNCHPHRFRRTMATNALKKGMSILDIQRMLGHECIDTTKIYLDLDDTDLKYQHEKYM